MTDDNFVSFPSLGDEFCCQEKQADVWFHCFSKENENIQRIPGHTFILRRSPKFNAQFGENWAEGNGKREIKVEDVSAEGFKALMQFIYKIECDFHVILAPEVLYLAKMHFLKDLRDEAIKKMEIHLEIYNKSCLILLNDLLKFGAKDSKIFEKCLDLIAAHICEAVKQDSFLELSSETLTAILRRNELDIDEIDLILSVIKWALQECNRRGLEISDVNKKSVLDPLLQFLRFPTLTMGEMSKFMEECELLTDEEIGTIIKRRNPSLMRWNFTPRTKLNARTTPLKEMRVFILGGQNLNYAACSDIREFNALTGVKMSNVKLNKQRFGCTAAIIGSKVLVFGGWQHIRENTVEIWNILDGNSKPELMVKTPSAMSYSAVCAIGTKVYVFGSEFGNQRSAHYFDVASNLWTVLADIPIDTKGASAFTYKTGILLIGGNQTGVVFYYDIPTNKWNQIVQFKLQNPIYYCTAVKLADESIVICGGSNNINHTGATNKCWKLPGNGTAWEEFPALKIARLYHRVIFYKGIIVVIGGYDLFGKHLKSVEIFMNDQWENANDLDISLAGFAAVVYPGTR